MNRHLYLSIQEEKALNLFAKGINSQIVRRECEIGRCSMDAFTFALRRKTGIRDQKDDHECQEYLRRYSEAIEKRAATPDQIALLRRVMNGETHQGIAYQMRISEAEVAPLITKACEAIGIFTEDQRARSTQIRIYLSAFHSTNGKPITTTEMQVLRFLASGVRPQNLCEHLSGKERYFVTLARNVCLRLGFNVRGKGTQRRMIQDYLARFDAEVMADPMF